MVGDDEELAGAERFRADLGLDRSAATLVGLAGDLKLVLNTGVERLDENPDKTFLFGRVPWKLLHVNVLGVLQGEPGDVVEV